MCCPGWKSSHLDLSFLKELNSGSSSKWWMLSVLVENHTIHNASVFNFMARDRRGILKYIVFKSQIHGYIQFLSLRVLWNEGLLKSKSPGPRADSLNYNSSAPLQLGKCTGDLRGWDVVQSHYVKWQRECIVWMKRDGEGGCRRITPEGSESTTEAWTTTDWP